MTDKPQRTALIRPDRPAVAVFAIILVMIVMTASMVFSYDAIADAATWSGPTEGINWIAPIFIDGAIIMYSISLTIFEWRREDIKTVRHTRRVLRGFTLLSVTLNFAHAASYWKWDFTVYEAWFGALIAVAAPIAALLSAEEIVRLAFRRHRISEDDMADGPDAPAELPAPSELRAATSAAAIVTDAPHAQVATMAAVEEEVVPEPPRREVLAPAQSHAEDPVAPDEEAAPTIDDLWAEAGEAPLGDFADPRETFVADVERFLSEGDEADSGIIRYPAQGESLIRGNASVREADHYF